MRLHKTTVDIIYEDGDREYDLSINDILTRHPIDPEKYQPFAPVRRLVDGNFVFATILQVTHSFAVVRLQCTASIDTWDLSDCKLGTVLQDGPNTYVQFIQD